MHVQPPANAITIIIGIFFTVIIANKNGGIDISVSEDLMRIAQSEIWNSVNRNQYSFSEIQELIDARHAELEEEAGLNDPFWPKHLRWTWNALQLDLGNAVFSRVRSVYWMRQDADNIRNVILDRLPNTLVIIVADHGEVLGEHQMMGHAFGIYQELVHALLLIRSPEQVAGMRVSAPVSATGLFHTV